ncbi:Acetyltransferase (GNAT) family protein [Actinomadura madurae]|uniref:Acetyltransferase (GNAT) family protein n=1 Tax=Actinomadura madurae TaxID=1993 RepID=A0A1I5ESI0_9ACTN|nr:GNAT family N-acetyltransferase [Actinomadura madurae]SFO14468.1 Acetyltransferase (GNAT) family protein [Actinomadura madurae]
MHSITHGSPDDAEAIARLTGGHIQAEHLAAALADATMPAHALIVRDRGQVIGAAVYALTRAGGDLARTLYITNIAVTPPQRRTGVGRALADGLRDAAHEHGCDRAEWRIEETDRQTAAFCRALGLSPDRPRRPRGGGWIQSLAYTVRP